MIGIDPKKVRLAAVVSNAIFTKTVLVVGGYYLGNFADKKWGTSPYLGLLGLAAGLGAGLAYLLYVVKKERG